MNMKLLAVVTPLSIYQPICSSTALVLEVWCILVLGRFILSRCSFMCTLPVCPLILVGNSGKGLWGCPFLVLVAVWHVQVLRLLVCHPSPGRLVCIWISSCFICFIVVSSWGRILYTSVAILATEVGCTVGTMFGSSFGVEVYSVYLGGWGNGILDMCAMMPLTSFDWWCLADSIVISLVSSSLRWAVRKRVLKLIQFCSIGFIWFQVLIVFWNFLILLIIVWAMLIFCI